MKVVRAHNMTRQAAADKIASSFDEFVSGFDDTVSGVSRTWSGDTMEFEFRARGLNFKGTLEVTDADYEIDLSIPLALRPFEGLVAEKLEEGIDDFLEG
jgi:hypothetical protein